MRFRQAILSVNGKNHTLLPNRANTFEEIYADFQQSEEGRYTVFLHPKEDVTIQGLEIQFEVPLPPEARFFANGYQSWSESRLLGISDQIPGLRSIARHFMGNDGDDGIPGIPRGKGRLHSWTYTYMTGISAAPGDKEKILFLGSLNERTGFTLFLYDQSSGTLSVRKDMNGLVLQHSFPALDFWVGKGAEQEVFDAYFRMAEVAPPAAAPCIGWTSGHQHFTQVSEALLLKNLDAYAAGLSQCLAPSQPLPMVCFQVGEGWQKSLGDWLSPKPEFPSGMRNIALKIKEKEMLPGLWMAPFVVSSGSDVARKHPEWLLKDAKGRPLKVAGRPAWNGECFALDFYHDGVREYLSGVFHTVIEKWGFELLELDFLFAVALAPPPGKTRGGVMWEAMEFLRHLVGSRRIIASGVPLGACFGQADYCRVGGEVHQRWQRPLRSFWRHREQADTLASLRSVLGRWQLNGRAFLNAPDGFVLRTEKQGMSPVQQQTLLAITALLGGMHLTSDEVGQYSEEQMDDWAEALSLRGSRLRQVKELETDVWKIDFEQGGVGWTAFCNLSKQEKMGYLPNANGIALRPFESIVLKS